MVRALTAILCFGMVCASPSLAQTTSAPNATLPAPAPPSATPSLGSTVDCLCQTAEPANNFYAGAEFLLYWFKPVCLNVPVVSVGGDGKTNEPGIAVAVGGSPPFHFDFGATPGGEITVGWISSDGMFGAEVTGFLMDTAAATQGFVAGPNSPASFLPYQDPTNAHQALPFTVPGAVIGSSTAIGSTHVWGIEANLTVPYTIERGGCVLQGTFLVGARYLDLTDRDRIMNFLAPVDDPSSFAMGADQVTTRNQFAGPQIGSTVGATWGKFALETTLKLAAGETEQARNIQGSPLSVISAADPGLLPGPLIALPSNIGRETAERVTLVPEIDVKARLALNSWCSVTLGYSLFYWNKVLCPGDQMDTLVNITQLPGHGPVTGTLDPAPLFVHTDYFAQGLHVGVELRF
jgi:Putative beta barrel porin-7 (BBP7)